MAAPNRPPRKVVEFPLNVPQTVALKYSQGKLVAGQYGERMLFTLTDGRAMFVSPQVAGQIEAAGINVRESFTITQAWDGAKTSPRTWKVERLVGEQPNGTLVVPALPPERPEAKPAQRATSATPTPEEGSTRLIAESKALVDAYAAVLDHALTTHSGRVKPDEVKSIFLTCVINLAGSKRHAA